MTLWTEKYRPKKIDDIIGQSHITRDIIYWHDGMPNLLLYGIAGVGKTATAGVIASFVLGEDLDGNFFEINASDDRRLEVVRTTIKEIASSMKIGNVPHKIILLDEMDGMTPDAQNALKRLMERFSGNVRFIITCNERSKIIYPLQSRCANYAFHRLSDNDIYYVLDMILANEDIEPIKEEQMRAFIGSCNGDLRRGITELQASVFSNTDLSIQIERMREPYSDLLQNILDGNTDKAHTQMLNLIAQSVDFRTVCSNLHDLIMERNQDHNYIDSNTKFKLLRIIGESEWRSPNMTPKVLASWMMSQVA